MVSWYNSVVRTSQWFDPADISSLSMLWYLKEEYKNYWSAQGPECWNRHVVIFLVAMHQALEEDTYWFGFFFQNQAGWIGFYATIAGIGAGILLARFSDFFGGRIKRLLLFLFFCSSASFLWFSLLCLRIIPFSEGDWILNRYCAFTVCYCAEEFWNSSQKWM